MYYFSFVVVVLPMVNKDEYTL